MAVWQMFNGAIDNSHGAGHSARNRRRFWLLHVAVPGFALAAILGGFRLNLPWVMASGIGVLGARFVAAGIFALREHSILVWNPNYYRFPDAIREYRGLAAIPMGVAGVLGGAVILTAVLAYLSGMSLEEMRSAIFTHPALALVPIGLVLVLYGLGFMMGFRDDGDVLQGPAAWNALLTFPGRLGGLILVLLGAGLVGMGAWEMMHPGSLPNLVSRGLYLLAGT